MYLFEACPYKVISESGEITCFDSGPEDCVRRSESTLRDFCRKDFKVCPYYLTQGTKSRFSGDWKYPRTKVKRITV